MLICRTDEKLLHILVIIWKHQVKVKAGMPVQWADLIANLDSACWITPCANFWAVPLPAIPTAVMLQNSEQSNSCPEIIKHSNRIFRFAVSASDCWFGMESCMWYVWWMACDWSYSCLKVIPESFNPFNRTYSHLHCLDTLRHYSPWLKNEPI